MMDPRQPPAYGGGHEPGYGGGPDPGDHAPDDGRGPTPGYGWGHDAAYQDDQGYPGHQGYPGGQDGGSGWGQDAGYQGDQGDHGYRGGYQQGYEPAPGYQPGYEPGYDDGYDDGIEPAYPPSRGHGSGAYPPGRHGPGRRRPKGSQTVPAVVLVLVLIAAVIGITRYIAGRTVAQREQASATVTTGPDAGGAGGQAAGEEAGEEAGAGGAQGGQEAQQAPATTTTTAGGAGGGVNLVGNASFEGDDALDGWERIGAGAERVQPGWKSDTAVLVRPAGEGGGPVAGLQTSLDRGETGGTGRTLSATAWVKAATSGTSARIALLERSGGKIVAGDLVTLPLYDTEWHVVQVKHRLRASSGTVDLAVGAARGQEGGVLVDAVTAKPAGA